MLDQDMNSHALYCKGNIALFSISIELVLFEVMNTTSAPETDHYDIMNAVSANTGPDTGRQRGPNRVAKRDRVSADCQRCKSRKQKAG
jgi:hypothetical protein